MYDIATDHNSDEKLKPKLLRQDHRQGSLAALLNLIKPTESERAKRVIKFSVKGGSPNQPRKSLVKKNVPRSDVGIVRQIFSVVAKLPKKA